MSTIDPKPRLLVVTPDFPPSRGGIQTLMAGLRDHLEHYAVTVVTRGTTDDAQVVAVGDPNRGHKRSLLLMNLAAVRTGLRLRPRVIVAGHIMAAPASVLVARLLRVPVVLYIHADEVSTQARLTRWAVRRATRVIAVSEHTAELARAHGAVADRVDVIHPGIDVPPATAEQERSPTILFVSRMKERYKGHDRVIEAVAQLRDKHPGLRCAFVGDGPLRPELEALARVAEVEDLVTFAGRVSDAERDELLRTSAVFVMPSRLPPGRGGEGFGIVYLEAAASRLPVVAGKVAGALDAVRDGETGFLVDPDDAAAIAAALDRLLSDPELARTMGHAGRAWAEQHAWPIIAQSVETTLRRAISAGD